MVRSFRAVLDPLIDALEHTRSMKWVREDLDIEAFAFWNTGNMTGRIFSEMTDDADIMARSHEMAIRPAILLFMAP